MQLILKNLMNEKLHFENPWITHTLILQNSITTNVILLNFDYYYNNNYYYFEFNNCGDENRISNISKIIFSSFSWL